MAFYKNIFFLIISFLFGFFETSFAQRTTKCRKSIEQLNLDLFDPQSSQSLKNPEVHSRSSKTNSSNLNVENSSGIQKSSPYSISSRSNSNIFLKKQHSRQKISSKQKEEISQRFLTALERENFKEIKELAEKFPFLKNIRFKSSLDLINKNIKEEDLSYCPEGWSPVQFAVYTKNIPLLEQLLSLNFNVRAKKKRGGESLEDNPLHIAIKVNFKEGARKILSHIGPTRFGVKNRFIDEKNRQKRTPWFIAVKKDLENQFIDFTPLIGMYYPSGHVESYGKYGLEDGFETAKRTQIQEIIDIANNSLKTSNYLVHKEAKELYGRRTKAPAFIR